MDTRDILLALDIYCEHDWDKTYDTILNKNCDFYTNENIMIRVEAEKYAILAEGYKIVVLTDSEYPKVIFNSSSKPPFVIYYKGDLDTVADRYSYQSHDINPKRMFID